MWECVVVLVLKLSGRREGARGPSEASAVLLAAGCCCRNELAHARIDPFFRSGTAPNPLRCEKDLGRGSAPEAGHTNTRTRLASKLLVLPSQKCRAGCTGRSGSACATLGAERVQGLLSGERRSLAAPSGAPRARAVLKPPSDRGKSVSPLQGLLHGALAPRGSNSLPWHTYRELVPLSCGFYRGFGSSPNESSDVSR